MSGKDALAFRWLVCSQDSTTTLQLGGELDLAAVLASKDGLVEEVEQSTGNVVLDASDLDFIDSTGLRLLLDLKFRLDGAQPLSSHTFARTLVRCGEPE